MACMVEKPPRIINGTMHERKTHSSVAGHYNQPINQPTNRLTSPCDTVALEILDSSSYDDEVAPPLPVAWIDPASPQRILIVALQEWSEEQHDGQSETRDDGLYGRIETQACLLLPPSELLVLSRATSKPMPMPTIHADQSMDCKLDCSNGTDAKHIRYRASWQASRRDTATRGTPTTRSRPR